jgi:predicted RNA-binding protein YlxR (DUF448 family)
MSTPNPRILRRCAGCGVLKQKSEMIRVIRTKEGEVLVDETQKRNGRGSYVCKSFSCLDAAVRRKGLPRDLKYAVDQRIYDRLREIIEAGTDHNG